MSIEYQIEDKKYLRLCLAGSESDIRKHKEATKVTFLFTKLKYECKRDPTILVKFKFYLNSIRNFWFLGKYFTQKNIKHLCKDFSFSFDLTKTVGFDLYVVLSCIRWWEEDEAIINNEWETLYNIKDKKAQFLYFKEILKDTENTYWVGSNHSFLLRNLISSLKGNKLKTKPDQFPLRVEPVWNKAKEGHKFSVQDYFSGDNTE